MTREELMNKIKTIIEKEPMHDMNRDYITSNFKDKKNGIYFLYNQKKTVIYVGKCGNGINTSFYHRMYGHGYGAHCKKKWFKCAKKFRFKAFPNLDKDKLKKVERLMIYANNQPIYNDCYISKKDIEIINSNL